MKVLAALVTLATVLAAGTPAAAQEAPAGSGITGLITDLAGTTVLIEEDPLERSGSAKASVEITAETRIYRQRGQERVPATTADLEAGQRVEATFVGPVAESYPVQATAGSITILKAPNPPAGGSSSGDTLPDTGGLVPAPPVVLLLAGGCLLASALLGVASTGAPRSTRGARTPG